MMCRMVESRAIEHLDPFRPLDVDEVVDGCCAEWREANYHVCRKPPGMYRKLRPPQMWRGAGGSEDVVHEGEMQHFLERHLAQGAPPAFDRLELLRRHALVGGAQGDRRDRKSTRL